MVATKLYFFESGGTSVNQIHSVAVAVIFKVWYWWKLDTGLSERSDRGGGNFLHYKSQTDTGMSNGGPAVVILNLVVPVETDFDLSDNGSPAAFFLHGTGCQN